MRYCLILRAGLRVLHPVPLWNGEDHSIYVLVYRGTTQLPVASKNLPHPPSPPIFPWNIHPSVRLFKPRGFWEISITCQFLLSVSVQAGENLNSRGCSHALLPPIVSVAAAKLQYLDLIRYLAAKVRVRYV